MQIYGNFEGFPVNSAWSWLVQDGFLLVINGVVAPINGLMNG